MTENQERGEFALELDGATFVMRPSYEAIVAFEAETGKGLMDLTGSVLGGKATVTELAIVATHCIRAWGREHEDTGSAGVNAKRIGGLIVASDGGVSTAMMAIGTMLALAASGGITVKGEVKAAAVMKEPKTASPPDAA